MKSIAYNIIKSMEKEKNYFKKILLEVPETKILKNIGWSVLYQGLGKINKMIENEETYINDRGIECPKVTNNAKIEAIKTALMTSKFFYEVEKDEIEEKNNNRGIFIPPELMINNND